MAEHNKLPESQCNDPCKGDATGALAKSQGGFPHCGAGSKNTIMRVRCVSNWGWWLIGLLGLGAAGYVGGFALHAHKVQGLSLIHI